MIDVKFPVLVRAVRSSLGLTQRKLAARAGVAQPSIAAFESERRDLTTSRLERIAHGLGYQVALLPAGYLTAIETAERVNETIEAQGAPRAEVHLLQLADDLAAAEPALRCALVATAPPLTRDRRFDAWLAGLVEYRLSQVGVPAPRWVNDPERSSPSEWVVGGLSGLADVVRDRTPEPLRRRGVLVSENDLVSIRRPQADGEPRQPGLGILGPGKGQGLDVGTR
jgi:transcriptional regulator with XRE-family HTH domain